MSQDALHSLYPSQYIETSCCIIERFARTAYHAILPNGKKTIAFVQRKEEALLDLIHPGSRVHVTISPADLDRARIRSIIDNNSPS